MRYSTARPDRKRALNAAIELTTQALKQLNDGPLISHVLQRTIQDKHPVEITRKEQPAFGGGWAFEIRASRSVGFKVWCTLVGNGSYDVFIEGIKYEKDLQETLGTYKLFINESALKAA